MNGIQLDPDMITFNEAVPLAKGKVQYGTIRNAVLSGEIVGTKVGFAWLISKRSLLDWLKQREQRRRQRAQKASTHATA